MVLGGSVASKFSYQGRLTDGQGNPLDGDYDLVFQIWDDAAGGSQVGGDIILRDVPVADGLFTVELTVPHNEIHGQALWLQVQVEGQVLSPRQELLPVPYALSLKPGAQIYGPSEAALYLGSGSEDGVVGETDASNKAGVFGHSAVGTGVRAAGHKGVEAVGYTGVYARSDADEGEGVHGHGTGERTEGVLGTADGAHGRGVWGIASGAGPDTYGVSGRSVNADGVEGYTESADRSGVFGHSDNGWGVYGFSANKPGVLGETLNPDLSGVYGHSSVAAGVRGRSEGNAGVVGWTGSTNASGVLGHSQVAAGVRGMSDGFHGIEGVTSSSNPAHAGVYARNDGAGPAAWVEGDLVVTGAYRGDIGPNGGAPLARPAYDSGWVALDKGESKTLTHNLGGNVDNYVVLMNQRNWGHGYTNFGDGLYLRDDEWAGYYWSELGAETVDIWRGTGDLFSDGFECRVRIWVYR
jgi:hypothetical protein